MCITILVGIIGTIFLKGIYALLRLRRGSLKFPNTYLVGDVPLNYLSITELISMRNKRWAQYFLFRTIPPALSAFLVIAILDKSVIDNKLLTALALTIMIILFFVLDIPLARRENHSTSWKLLYCLIVVLAILASAAVFALCQFVDLSFLYPNFTNAIDSLWAALFAAIVVAFFLTLTNMNPSRIEIGANDASFYSGQKSLLYSKFDLEIQEASSICFCDPDFLYAILIYENLNRPKIIRILENAFVAITHKKLTVGIAQVKSDRPLNDKESILQMGYVLKRIKESQTVPSDDLTGNLTNVLSLYNTGKDYPSNVLYIYSFIKDS